MSNPNTPDILRAELARNPRAVTLTPAQRQQVIERATPALKVAGGNVAESLDQTISDVLFGIPPAS